MSLKFIVLLAIVNITLGVSMHVFDGYPSRYSESELAVFDKYGGKATVVFVTVPAVKIPLMACACN